MLEYEISRKLFVDICLFVCRIFRKIYLWQNLYLDISWWSNSILL